MNSNDLGKRVICRHLPPPISYQDEKTFYEVNEPQAFGKEHIMYLA